MAGLSTVVLAYAAFPNLLSNRITFIAPNDYPVTYEGRWAVTKFEAVADCAHTPRLEPLACAGRSVRISGVVCMTPLPFQLW